MCPTALVVGNSSLIKQNIPKPRDPLNFDLNIPKESKTTMDAKSQSFMVFDGEQLDSRILIFASKICH